MYKDRKEYRDAAKALVRTAKAMRQAGMTVSVFIETFAKNDEEKQNLADALFYRRLITSPDYKNPNITLYWV